MARYFSTSDAPEYIRTNLLYERKAVTEIWSKLTLIARQQWKWKNFEGKEHPDSFACKKRIVQIYGPPGTGKSSAAFKWVRSVCETCRTKAYWISCANGTEHSWTIAHEAGTGQVTIAGGDSAAIPQKAQDMSDATIVVFDGIRLNTVERWRGLMNDLARAGMAVIVVSSEGVRFHEGDSGDIMKLNHIVPSWTLEEYFGACSNDEFWRNHHRFFQDATLDNDQQDRPRFIRTKFLSAGHSARYMFHAFEAEIKRRISEDSEAMGGIDSLEEAVRNTRSTGSVNALMARLHTAKNGTTPQDDAAMPTVEDLEASGVSSADFVLLDGELDLETPQPRLVSAFASEEVRKKIPSSVERLRRIAHSLSNKVIEGYAFEEQLKKSLRAAVSPGRSLVVWDQDRQRVDLSVDDFILCDASEVVETLSTYCSGPNTWIFVGGQQGAFDAIHVVSTTHLRFIQSTVGQNHIFYLDVVDRLIRNLAHVHTWTHVEFLLLRPETERRREFSLRPARGSLQPNFLRFDEAPWNRRDHCRENVKYCFLGWTE